MPNIRSELLNSNNLLVCCQAHYSLRVSQPSSSSICICVDLGTLKFLNRVEVRRWWEKKWSGEMHVTSWLVRVLCLFVSLGKQINSIECLFFIFCKLGISAGFFSPLVAGFSINSTICDPVYFLCHECLVVKLILPEEQQIFVFPPFIFSAVIPTLQ